MTPHMLDLVRDVSWHERVVGPVLEVGAYKEAHQEHLDMRRAFPPGTAYLGVDVVDGSGVDERADVCDANQMLGLVERVAPRVVLCLYVLEHVWDIRQAAHVLGEMHRRNPESWLWVTTHQHQPFHGTATYPDYWRITASGMEKLFRESGLESPHVIVHADSSNPEDVVMVQQPLSQVFPQRAFDLAFVSAQQRGVHWERVS